MVCTYKNVAPSLYEGTIDNALLCGSIYLFLYFLRHLRRPYCSFSLEIHMASCSLWVMYILGNSRWQCLRSTLYKAPDYLCSHFAVYLSNEIRTQVCNYTVMIVRSLFKDSSVRYSSKYYKDQGTGILQRHCPEDDSIDLLLFNFLSCVVLQ